MRDSISESVEESRSSARQVEEGASPVPPNFNPLRFCRPRTLAAQERHALIANAAYLRAEQRGFGPGHELEDWLAAEAEVDRHLAAGRTQEQKQCASI
jgi:hypothetical protein